ncbi:4 -methoxyviridicatin aspoquinolone biosynthesis cluster asqM [Hyphodiscus hymeniophilus]|uniref:4 -methoxyviridicatin aspoquinolone biosynthesis cluster asqM n=1 Tax=Hyphodiscus hymeniophilus TaxID=353542 RepID=A0A9P7AUL2_9HELO|nr:4 -methoxyviridicatin aspoquinolone biosynthesis cluster asqM [Hyphodiscus hymeniophilus]
MKSPSFLSLLKSPSKQIRLSSTFYHPPHKPIFNPKFRMSSSKQPRIAILGGGPGGLTLASLFTKFKIPYTVFELRSRPSPADLTTPSGSLDLHADDGLLALESCGLMDQFIALTGECSEDTIIADKHGKVHLQSLHEVSRHRPEISRNALTHLLISSIPEETIRWEHKVSSVQQVENGRWRLNFASTSPSSVPESVEEFDLVIGADGAWSKVRPELTEVKPIFSGKNWITLTIPYLTSKYPHLDEMLGKGSYMACEAGKGVIVQRGTMESARVYLIMDSPPCADPENWLHESRLSTMTPLELKTQLLTKPELYASWGESIRELISVGCDAGQAGSEMAIRGFYMLPSCSWEHRRGLTLIGDAAHLTLPSGEGVNAAMLEALQLSRGIAKALSAGTDFDEALAEYEKALFPRAKDLMADAVRMTEMLYAEDAPRSMVRFIESHMHPEE